MKREAETAPIAKTFLVQITKYFQIQVMIDD